MLIKFIDILVKWYRKNQIDRERLEYLYSRQKFFYKNIKEFIIVLEYYSKKYNKLSKGVWRMPRLSETTKDVISCEKLRGGAHTF